MSNFVTRSKAFGRLTKWAFTVCDIQGTGKIGRTELYAGILLVHVQLAKYVGPAACYPPSREVIDQLFDACDDDKSGYIEEDEFVQIMVVCCAQIAGRIMVYIGLLVVMAPYLAKGVIRALVRVDDWMGWNARKGLDAFKWIEHVLTWGELAEKVVGFLIFVRLVSTGSDYCSYCITTFSPTDSTG